MLQVDPSPTRGSNSPPITNACGLVRTTVTSFLPACWLWGILADLWLFCALLNVLNLPLVFFTMSRAQEARRPQKQILIRVSCGWDFETETNTGFYLRPIFQTQLLRHTFKNLPCYLLNTSYFFVWTVLTNGESILFTRIDILTILALSRHSSSKNKDFSAMKKLHKICQVTWRYPKLILNNLSLVLNNRKLWNKYDPDEREKSILNVLSLSIF